MFLGLEDCLDVLGGVYQIEPIDVLDELALLVVVGFEVVVGVVHVLIEDVDVQLIEFGVAGFVFLALGHELLELAELVLLEAAWKEDVDRSAKNAGL